MKSCFVLQKPPFNAVLLNSLEHHNTVSASAQPARARSFRHPLRHDHIERVGADSAARQHLDLRLAEADGAPEILKDQPSVLGVPEGAPQGDRLGREAAVGEGEDAQTAAPENTGNTGEDTARTAPVLARHGDQATPYNAHW